MGAILTCLAFLSKPPNTPHERKKNTIQIFIPDLDLDKNSRNRELDTILLETQERLRSKIQERVNKVDQFCKNQEDSRRLDSVLSQIIVDV